MSSSHPADLPAQLFSRGMRARRTQMFHQDGSGTFLFLNPWGRQGPLLIMVISEGHGFGAFLGRGFSFWSWVPLLGILMLVSARRGEEEPRGSNQGRGKGGGAQRVRSQGRLCPDFLVLVRLHSAHKAALCFPIPTTSSLTPQRARSPQGRVPVDTGVDGQALQES